MKGSKLAFAITALFKKLPDLLLDRVLHRQVAVSVED